MKPRWKGARIIGVSPENVNAITRIARKNGCKVGRPLSPAEQVKFSGEKEIDLTLEVIPIWSPEGMNLHDAITKHSWYRDSVKKTSRPELTGLAKDCWEAMENKLSVIYYDRGANKIYKGYLSSMSGTQFWFNGKEDGGTEAVHFLLYPRDIRILVDPDLKQNEPLKK